MKKTIIPLMILSLSLGCTQKAKDDSEKAAESAADSFEDVAKTIRTVKDTADQVKQIGMRINNIKGLEITAANPVWEYKVVTMKKAATDSTEDELNELGQEGWELATRLGGSDGTSLVFKRRKALMISGKEAESKKTDE
jgi:hypothetical protein